MSAVWFAACCPPPSPDAPLPTLEVGTSNGDEVSFRKLSEAQGVFVVRGGQGGFHIWLSIRVENFELPLTAEYGVRDALTGEALTMPHLQNTVWTLDDDGSTRFTAFLQYADFDSWNGKQVVLWADVHDNCHRLSSAGVTTVVPVRAPWEPPL